MTDDDKLTIEQEEDAALDQILGDDLDTQEMVEPTDIPPSSEEEQEAEDAADDEEWEYEYEEEETSEQDSTTPVDPASVLKRDNVPQEFADALREKFGDEAVDAWVSKAASRQQAVDKFSAEMRELKQQISDLRDGTNSADDKQPTGNTDHAADSEASQQDDLGQVAEIYGDELADPIRATRDQLNKLNQELSNVRQESELRESIAFALGDIAVERGGLTAEQRAEITAKANEMGSESPGTFASVADLIGKASREVLGPVFENKPEAKKPRRRSQITPPSQTPIPEKPLTREQEEDLALDRILADFNP
tara:strand:- start:3089 stop:4012 length:924 start_codon:yes stop_codon:yes gene_type:complete